jgi:quinol-cytochrome oxidoreductase complex cytochrome b subunit
MYKSFIRKNNISSAIILFLLLFILFVYIKPNFLFNKSGALRNFGLGKTNSTILPIWLLVIITAIASYLIILCYLL